jgi:hypothetical protein
MDPVSTEYSTAPKTKHVNQEHHSDASLSFPVLVPLDSPFLIRAAATKSQAGQLVSST